MKDIDIYKLVYEIATEAMIVADRNGMIVEANPSAVRFFKYPMDVLIGMNVDDLLPEALRKIHGQHRDGYMRDPQRRSMGSGLNLLAQDAEGKLIPVEISLNHAQFNGQFRVVALISDITARKEAENRVLQLNRELEEGVAQRTIELNASLQITLKRERPVTGPLIIHCTCPQTYALAGSLSSSNALGKRMLFSR